MRCFKILFVVLLAFFLVACHQISSGTVVDKYIDEPHTTFIQGAEIKGRVLQKEKIGDMYTITVQNYGVFVVTKTNYESLKIGDEVRL